MDELLKGFAREVRSLVYVRGYVSKMCTLESVRNEALRMQGRFEEAQATARQMGLDLSKEHLCDEQIRYFAKEYINVLELACVFRRQLEVDALVAQRGTPYADCYPFKITQYVSGGGNIARVASMILGPDASPMSISSL